jgi:hypothetical protein
VATVQLRRYRLASDHVAEFLRWFPRAVETRVPFGFGVEFAYLDREAGEFTWAVTHSGDDAQFDEAEAAWRADPHRDAVYHDLPTHCIVEHFIARVECCNPVD